MSAPRHHQPLPDAARRALWDRLWDRLLQPLPTEVVVGSEQRPDPSAEGERRRDREVPR
jgi:hypothetical protein